MANKTVGIDARMWGHPGIGRYIRELSAELIHCCNEENLVFFGEPGLIQRTLAERQSSGPTRCIQAVSRIYSLTEQWEMLKLAASVDLLHVPHFNIPYFSKTKLVATIHDLIYLHEPTASKSRFGKFYSDLLIKRIVDRSSAVIAVSEYTKNDLLNYFPKLSADKVFVTYEAPASVFRKINDTALLDSSKKKHKLLKPFVLFIGTLKPHKNAARLIEAVKILRDAKGLDHELVLVGRQDARNEDLLRLIRKNSFVRYLGELVDEELVSLYNLAEVFVLPSFYEGFGLPVIEAMACGTPVIASNRTSLPEVVGRAGALFDPLNVDALTALLYNVLMDSELRKNMINMGLEQAKKFSWRHTAEQTMRVYQQAMN